ncbi:MAG: ACT domain-containing protein [Desulforhopalus sp.]|jgi:ACT domain-containing protein
MLHSNNLIIKHKTGLLNLAEELGNVSQACSVMGLSRDTFYRYQNIARLVWHFCRTISYRYNISKLSGKRGVDNFNIS